MKRHYGKIGILTVALVFIILWRKEKSLTTLEATRSQSPEKPYLPAPRIVELPSPVVAPQPAEQDSPATRESGEGTVELIDLYSESLSDTRVCQLIPHSPPISPKEARAALDFSDALGSNRENAIDEALRVSAKALFQIPEMKDILGLVDPSVRALPAEQRHAILEKRGFYQLLEDLAPAIRAHDKRVSAITDHSIHLAILAKMAALRPELRGSEKLLSLCQRWEDQVEGGSALGIQTERQKLLKFMKSSGVTPEEVGFDPMKFSDLTLKWSRKGVWMGDRESKEP